MSGRAGRGPGRRGHLPAQPRLHQPHRQRVYQVGHSYPFFYLILSAIIISPWYYYSEVLFRYNLAQYAQIRTSTNNNFHYTRACAKMMDSIEWKPIYTHRRTSAIDSTNCLFSGENCCCCCFCEYTVKLGPDPDPGL